MGVEDGRNLDISVEAVPRDSHEIARMLGSCAVNDPESMTSKEPLIEQVEPELMQRERLWSELEKHVQHTLTDEEPQQHLEDLITFCHTDEAAYMASRKVRRKARNESAKLYPKLITVYVYSGRLHNIVKEDWLLAAEDRNMAKTIMGVPRQAQEISRTLRKKENIIDSFPDSEEKRSLHSYLYELENTNNTLHGSIYKNEQNIHKKVDKYIRKRGPYAFLGEVIERSNSEADTDQELIQFLLQDLNDRGDYSLLEYAMEAAGELAEQGGLARSYLEHLCSDPNGLFAYMQNHFVSTRSNHEFITAMARSFDDWPRDLRAGYKQYIDQQQCGMQRRFEQLQEQYADIVSSRSLPTLEQYEMLMDEVTQSLWPGSKESAKKQSTGAAPPKIKTPRQADEKSPEQEPEPPKTLHKAEIRDNRVVFAGEETPEQLAKRFRGRKNTHKQDFVHDVARCLEELSKDAFQEGITTLNEIKPLQLTHDQQSRVYRLRPDRLSGVSVGKTAKAARILFVVNEDRIGILDIPNKHDTYERTIDRLK